MTAHENEHVSDWQKQAIHVSDSVVIDRPVGEIYNFWRNFEQLPMFMTHLASVQVLPDGRSLWKAKMPGGLPVEWVATVVEDVPNEVIAWRSEDDAVMPNAGTVRFKPVDDFQTEVQVEMDYRASMVGEVIAELMGSDPKTSIRHDLKRLKDILEMELSDDTKPSWSRTRDKS